mgnify:CR=1 FL=1
MGKASEKNRRSIARGNKVGGLPKEELRLLKAMITIMTKLARNKQKNQKPL